MHDLRKTHITYLANHGYPVKALMVRAGHKKLETTLRYYINVDEDMKQQERRILNTITTEDPIIKVEVEGIGFVDVKQSMIDKYKK